MGVVSYKEKGRSFGPPFFKQLMLQCYLRFLLGREKL